MGGKLGSVVGSLAWHGRGRKLKVNNNRKHNPPLNSNSNSLNDHHIMCANYFDRVYNLGKLQYKAI